MAAAAACPAALLALLEDVQDEPWAGAAVLAAVADPEALVAALARFVYQPWSAPALVAAQGLHSHMTQDLGGVAARIAAGHALPADLEALGRWPAAERARDLARRLGAAMPWTIIRWPSVIASPPAAQVLSGASRALPEEALRLARILSGLQWARAG